MGLLQDLHDKARQMQEEGYLPGLRTDESGNPVCYYCGCRIDVGAREYEHVIPRHRGGLDVPWNAVWACSMCNHTKFTKHAIPWLFSEGRDLPDDVALDLIVRTIMAAYAAYR